MPKDEPIVTTPQDTSLAPANSAQPNTFSSSTSPDGSSQVTVEDYTQVHNMSYMQQALNYARQKQNDKHAENMETIKADQKADDRKQDREDAKEANRHSEAEQAQKDATALASEKIKADLKAQQDKYDFAFKCVGATLVALPAIVTAGVGLYYAYNNGKALDLQKSLMEQNNKMFLDLGTIVGNLEKYYADNFEKPNIDENALKAFRTNILAFAQAIPEPDAGGKVLKLRISVLNMQVENKLGIAHAAPPVAAPVAPAAAPVAPATGPIPVIFSKIVRESADEFMKPAEDQKPQAPASAPSQAGQAMRNLAKAFGDKPTFS